MASGEFEFTAAPTAASMTVLGNYTFEGSNSTVIIDVVQTFSSRWPNNP